MKSLPLFLQSALLMPLLAPLIEFATSTSGHVEPRQGLALGWLGSVVAGLAVVFGAADRAQAGYCHGISEGSSSWVKSSDICDWQNHKPVYYHYLYHHNSAGDSCVIQSTVCG